MEVIIVLVGVAAGIVGLIAFVRQRQWRPPADPAPTLDEIQRDQWKLGQTVDDIAEKLRQSFNHTVGTPPLTSLERAAALPGQRHWQQATEPTVKPMMAGTTDGKTAAFVIMIQNSSPDRLLSINIRAALHGNKLIHSWAGGDSRYHLAKNYGDVVGWDLVNIAPGRAQGPFVFAVEVGVEGAVSHAWLCFKTEKVSAYVGTGFVEL